MGSRKREEPTRKPKRERRGRYARARLNTCGLIKFIMK